MLHREKCRGIGCIASWIGWWLSSLNVPIGRHIFCQSFALRYFCLDELGIMHICNVSYVECNNQTHMFIGNHYQLCCLQMCPSRWKFSSSCGPSSFLGQSHQIMWWCSDQWRSLDLSDRLGFELPHREKWLGCTHGKFYCSEVLWWIWHLFALLCDYQRQELHKNLSIKIKLQEGTWYSWFLHWEFSLIVTKGVGDEKVVGGRMQIWTQIRISIKIGHHRIGVSKMFFLGQDIMGLACPRYFLGTGHHGIGVSKMFFLG